MPSTSDHRDDELLERLTDNDRERRRSALEQLYHLHGSAIIAYARMRVSAPVAEEIAQAAWLRAWNSLPDGFRGGDFRNWLLKITKNLIIDSVRGTQAETSDINPIVTNIDDSLIAHERAEALRDCVEGLSQRQADVVRAVAFGDGYDDVCRRLKIGHNAAYKFFHAAKARLRSCLEGKLD